MKWREEIGSFPSYRVTGVHVQDCGAGWKFHIVTADVDNPFAAYCVGKPRPLDGSRSKRSVTSLYTLGSGKWSGCGEQEQP